MNDTTNTEKTKPVHKVRLGNLSAPVWENRNEEGRAYYRTTLSKSYRDSKGEWQETGSFRSDDLIVLGRLIQLASDWMLARENE
jgi:hypothetical protein